MRASCGESICSDAWDADHSWKWCVRRKQKHLEQAGSETMNGDAQPCRRRNVMRTAHGAAGCQGGYVGQRKMSPSALKGFGVLHSVLVVGGMLWEQSIAKWRLGRGVAC